MGVTNLDLDMTIGTIVEAMLPRFSDGKLGLMIGMDLSFDDFGYAEDGNTKVRKEKHIRRFPHLLFVRPSNYTKVFFWEADPKSEGSRSALYYNEPLIWTLEHDHDSCWRDFGKITQIYFDCCAKFKKLKPFQVHTFNHLDEPKYVLLETFEQQDKMADRFSSEGRIWTIKTRSIERPDLEYLRSPDTKYMNSGLLIKGSEDYQQYQNSVKRCNERKVI